MLEPSLFGSPRSIVKDPVLGELRRIKAPTGLVSELRDRGSLRALGPHFGGMLKPLDLAPTLIRHPWTRNNGR